MASAKEWADILNKLGTPYTKKYVIERIKRESLSNEEVWNAFVLSDPLVTKAANASKLYNADDVDWYFRSVSYSHMRGSFSGRSHGRSILDPRVVSVQRIIEEEKN